MDSNFVTNCQRYSDINTWTIYCHSVIIIQCQQIAIKVNQQSQEVSRCKCVCLNCIKNTCGDWCHCVHNFCINIAAWQHVTVEETVYVGFTSAKIGNNRVKNLTRCECTPFALNGCFQHSILKFIVFSVVEL